MNTSHQTMKGKRTGLSISSWSVTMPISQMFMGSVTSPVLPCDRHIGVDLG